MALRNAWAPWWTDRDVKAQAVALLVRQSTVTATEVAAAIARLYEFDEADAGALYGLRLRCIDVLKDCERRGLVRFALGDRRERVTRRWTLNTSHPEARKLVGCVS